MAAAAASFRDTADAVERNANAMEDAFDKDPAGETFEQFNRRVDVLRRLVRRLRGRAEFLEHDAQRRGLLAARADAIASIHDPHDPAFYDAVNESSWEDAPIPGVVRLEGHGSWFAIHDTREGAGFVDKNFGISSSREVDLLARIPGFNGTQIVQYASCYSNQRAQFLANAIRERYGPGTGFVVAQGSGKNYARTPFKWLFIGQSPEAIEEEQSKVLVLP